MTGRAEGTARARYRVRLLETGELFAIESVDEHGQPLCDTDGKPLPPVVRGRGAARHRGPSKTLGPSKKALLALLLLEVSYQAERGTVSRRAGLAADLLFRNPWEGLEKI